MKKILVLLALVAAGWEAGFGQTCHPITQMYHRAIQPTAYTWGYDGLTGGARYKDGSLVQPGHVRDGIAMAVTAWTTAANGAGTAITLTETNWNSAQLLILFAAFPDAGFPCGTGTSTAITLNNRYQFDGVSSLWSTILHEMGHAFLGSDHHGNSGIMSCTVGGDCNKKVTSLSPEEVARTLELYNPPYTVIVKNDFGGGIGGGSATVDGVTYHNIPQAGKEFIWRIYQPAHTIAAVDYQEIPENNVVYVREYQRWRNQFNDLMAERPNLSFNPIVAQRTYTAYFLKLFNVTFANATFVEPGGSGGHYTVNGVQTTQTTIRQDNSAQIRAVPPAGWVFIEWSDTHPDKYTNPRQLAPTDHTTLHATFKKRLASTSATASGPNSQRKLDSFGGKEHAVYASGGSIWYTNNDGSGWSNESRLSFLSTAKNPSIATTYSAPYTVVHVVWEETQIWNGNEYHNVYYRKSTNSGAGWQSPVQVSGPFGSGLPPSAVNVDATPVVAGSPIVIIWKSGDIYSGSLKIQVEPLFGSSTYFTVDGSDGTSCSPTVRPMPQGPYKLAYRHGTGKIYYREFSLTGGYPYYSVAFDPSKSIDLMSGYSWMSDAANPSIVFDGTRTIVTWDATCASQGEEYDSRMHDGSMGSIGSQLHVLFREYTSSWLPVVEFSHYNYPIEKPSVGVNMNSSKVVLMWQLNGNTIDKISRNVTGGTWGSISILDGGTSPSLNHYVYGGNPTYAMYTSGSSAPYNIVMNANVASKPVDGFANNAREQTPNEEDSPNNPFGGFAVSRRGAIDLATLRFGRLPAGAVEGTLWIETPTIEIKRGAERERWLFLNDALNFSDWLGTGARIIPADADSIKGRIRLTMEGFKIVDTRVPLNVSIFSTDLVQSTGAQNAKRLTLGDLADLGVRDTCLLFSLNIPAQNLRGKQFRVRTRLIGQEESQEPAWSVLLAVDSTESGATAGRTTLSKNEMSGRQRIPTEFALHANYPNPFNPSTTIKFDLPENSNVSLVVYDVLGRKVAELANGYREAGYHNVQWSTDNNQLSSGVYFARFTARDASGTVKLSKVSKLMLAK